MLALDLPCVCSVNADFINLLWIISEIFDMAKNVTSTVLTHEVSKIRPET
jgi:hypothetical protein